MIKHGKTKPLLLTKEQNKLIKLIEKCKRNQRDSQKALYKMHFSYSMSICMRYSNSKEEAEEILNDGFMKIFKHIESFETSKPFLPWLKRILINTAINKYRSNQRRVEEVDLEYGYNDFSSDSVMDLITYEEMLEVVRKLSPAYRAVFNLKAIEGYSHEEIAKMLNISVGTSKSNYAKAKVKLQHYMESYFELVR